MSSKRLALTRDFKERLTRSRVAGLMAGLAGVAVIKGPAALARLGRDLWAQAAMIAASVSCGFANVFGRRLRGTPPLVAAAGQVSATALMALPVVLVLDRPWTLAPPSPTAWAALAGLALLCTVLGGAVLGERLRSYHFVVMTLILAGLLLAAGRMFKPPKRFETSAD